MDEKRATRRELFKTIAMAAMVGALIGSKLLDARKVTRGDGDKRASEARERQGRSAKVML
jgi:hypothetical protein